MTQYSDYMEREHKSWCEYPHDYCSCSTVVDNNPEREFSVFCLVEVRSIGLPGKHSGNMIDRIAREMHLAFKGNATVYLVKEVLDDLDGISREVRLRDVEVVTQEVQRLHQGEGMPEVQGSPTGTGT